MARDGGGFGRVAYGGRLRHRRALIVAVWSLVAVLLIAGAGLGFVYYRLNGNIAGVDINSVLGTDRPADMPNGSLDLLVLGSDSRAGQNAPYGDDDGTARSDTAMIVHIHEDHERATVVSIPRDTLVRRPECRKPGGGTVPAERNAMFNSAYQAGGPACAVKTVERLTGVRMDHYVEIDFSGFRKLVDTLGGVEVTVNKPIDDPDSHLHLSPGTHTLDGEQALGLVRTRHAVGDGSDLGRIQLQQVFLRALLDKIDDLGLFSNPKQLYDLADTATAALTTDSELDSVADLVGIARLLRGVGPDELRLLTMPVRYDPQNPNRVVPMEHKAQQVWTALREDRRVPRSATEGTATDRSGIGDAVEQPGSG
ncbi:LCP family protein [Streptomyces sp. JJ36]|uniref:LCP family protein n=1 Tax=Streptomyces sp. JJ36 TaxID=2736645 RepID=UPI001F200C46|nr:LCP family protein [Streptomyces sp. JJ36]